MEDLSLDFYMLDGSDDKAFDAATSQLNVSSSSCGSFNSAMSSNLNLSARSSISALSARSSKINLGANSSYSSLGDAMGKIINLSFPISLSIYALVWSTVWKNFE